MPPVWAIVLMYGGEEITAACIDSLLGQTYRALTVLLVDNASPDGSGVRLRDRYGQIRYLNTGSNCGYAGGNNRGMRHALDEGAEYLLVLNNDTIVEPMCVEALVASAQQAPKKVGVVSPKILFHDDPARIWFAGGDYSVVRALGVHRGEMELDDPAESPRLEEMSFATGCCFLMPASVARETGGFREEYFMYCEDLELSLRLMRSGHTLYYQPAARLRHRQKFTHALPSPFAALHRDRNRRRLVREHYTLPQRTVFALWFYPTRVVRLFQYVLQGNLPGARAILAGATQR